MQDMALALCLGRAATILREFLSLDSESLSMGEL